MQTLCLLVHMLLISKAESWSLLLLAVQLLGDDPASRDAAAMLAQVPGSAVAGLLAAERVMVAKQLAQHYCTNGAATGAVHDAKVTGMAVTLCCITCEQR
jgi:hypothetical protein